MIFENPIAFWFLPLALIPLLIHLIQFKQAEKLAFSTIVFLEELQKTYVKRVQLQEWILLLLRTLLLLLLILAFSKPRFGEVGSAQTHALIIDNSIGVDRVNRSGPIIEQIKKSVSTFIESRPKTDEFYLFFTTGNTVVVKSLDKENAIQRLNQIEFENKYIQIDEILNAVEEINTNQITIYTDQNLSKWEEVLKDKSYKKDAHYIVYSGVETSNAVINSVRAANSIIAGNNLEFIVDVELVGDKPLKNVRLESKINNVIVSEVSFDLEVGKIKNLPIQLGKLEVGSYSISFSLKGDSYESDNEYHLGINLPKKTSIAVITDLKNVSNSLDALIQAINSETGFFEVQLVALENLDVNATNYDGFVINTVEKSILAYVPLFQREINEGKGLVLIPSSDFKPDIANQFLSKLGLSNRFQNDYYQKIEPILISEIEHPITRELFDARNNTSINYSKPSHLQSYTFKQSANAFTFPVLKTSSGKAILIEERKGLNKVLVSSIGFENDWSDFQSNTLFAPFWISAFQYISKSRESGIYVTDLGDDIEIELNSIDESFRFEINQRKVKPERKRAGLKYMATLNTLILPEGFISFEANQLEKKFVGLNTSANYSKFSNEKIDSWEQKLAQHFKDIRVTSVNENRNDQNSSIVYSSGWEWWSIVALLAILLLIIESFYHSRIKLQQS